MLLPIFMEALTGSLRNVAQMAIIIIPLMIFVECFQDLNLLDRLTGVINPLSKLIGLDRQGNLPLLAGLLFGISYGAGIIISCAREGKLQSEDIFLINLFLVICHSLLEDTMLLAAIGANWVPIVIGRFILAIAVCTVWSRLTRINRSRTIKGCISG